MPLDLPTLAEVQERASKEFRARLSLGPLLPRGILDALVGVLAGAEHSLAAYVAWAADQLLPDTAEAEFLDRWGTILGEPRKAAAYSAGEVVFTGATNGSVIPAGTSLTRADGWPYESTASATVVATVATVLVASTRAGVLGDVDVGGILTLGAAISGVPSTGTVAAGGLSGGADSETDEQYRARVLDRFRTPPATGTAADYVRWALENAGVTRAWCLPNNAGASTVGVTFVQDGDPVSIIPTSAEVAGVQSYIDARAPVTAIVTVFAPSSVAVDFEVQLLVSTGADVQAAVTEALEELLRSEGGPDATIYLSHIREAISGAAGEVDHVLIAPAADLVFASNEIPELGTVTFS